MGPVLAPADVVNRGSADAVHGRNHPSRYVRRHGADIADIRLSQLCSPVPLTRRRTARLPPFGDLVGGIVAARAKEEVIDIAAGRVVAAVQDAQAFRDRPALDLPDCAVDLDSSALPVQCAIAERVRRSQPQLATTRNVRFGMKCEPLFQRRAAWGRRTSSHWSPPKQASGVRMARLLKAVGPSVYLAEG